MTGQLRDDTNKEDGIVASTDFTVEIVSKCVREEQGGNQLLRLLGQGRKKRTAVTGGRKERWRKRRPGVWLSTLRGLGGGRGLVSCRAGLKLAFRWI